MKLNILYSFVKYFLLTSIVTVSAATTTLLVIEKNKEEKGKKIASYVAINDFHGQLAVYEQNKSIDPCLNVVALADKYTSIKNKNEKLGIETKPILTGDNAQGSALSNLTKGEATYSTLKELGIDYSVVGNHEFDWGKSFLEERKFEQWGKLKTFLACNIYNKDDKKPVEWAKPYAIETISGINVGIVGYVTPETKITSAFENVKYFEFADANQDQALFLDTKKTGTEILQETIDACWSDTLNYGMKPDAVFVLAHDGLFINKDGSYNEEYGLYPVVNKIKNVNCYMTAHTHLSYVKELTDKDNKPVLLGQASCYGKELLETIFIKQNDQIDVKMHIHKVPRDVNNKSLENPKEELLTRIKNQYDFYYKKNKDKIEEQIFQLVGKKDGEEGIYNKMIKQKDEELGISPVGRLMAQSIYDTLQRSVITKNEGEWKIDKQIENSSKNLTNYSAEFVMLNNGGIRNNLIHSNSINNDESDWITMDDLFRISPFDNHIVIAKVKAKYINDIYTNKKRTAEWNNIAETFYSKKYRMGYRPGSDYFNSPDVCLCNLDGTQVDENEDVFIATIDFMFFSGDGYTFDVDIHKDNWMIPNAFTDWHTEDILANQRSLIKFWVGNVFGTPRSRDKISLNPEHTDNAFIITKEDYFIEIR